MHRHLTIVCALSILILGILTLTFSMHAKRVFQPIQSASPINVALATNGATASASSVHFSGNYPVAAVNNGDRKAMNWGNGGGWNDNTHGDYSSDIVQINFPAFNFVSQINVFTLRDNFQDNQTPPTLTETFSTCENTGFGITEFEVQYWNGWMWITVSGGLVRDNNKVWRQLTFPEVWASRVRVQVHGAARHTTTARNYSRIVEMEAFGRTAGFNLAAAANGAVASASTSDTNNPVSALNDGDRTGFNWGRGGFGSGWRDATENEYSIDWVRVDFAGGQARRINEIDVYTLRDEFSTNTDDPTIFETFPTADDSGGYGMTDYDVQYLSAGVWRNVPGGKVTNNNKVRRQFRFSPITTNAIRVAIHKGVHYTTPDLNWSRIVEIEAWENAAAPDDVVWVEDALPAGATTAGSFEGWNWTCFNPLPLSGTLAHTSENVAGMHQHFLLGASQTLTVNAGDTLVAHVYLDPVNPPTQVMLQWADNTWEHRAYWGENQLAGGVDGTVSRRKMGALPPTGQWVRLEVPASLVGLEGRTLTGMGFSLFNGRATWDHAGKYAGSAPVQPTISISDATTNEGNSGTTSAVFTMTLSSASSQTISVNHVTATNSATSSSDYVSASGTVTFAPGQTSKPITIQVVGDTAVESNENFFVNLSGSINATVADSQGIGTILNDDALPPISDVVWVEDALPAGAIAAGSFEGWNWTSINPSPLSGTLAHTSDIVTGVHQHYFYNATQTLTVNVGDTLIAHVYLDPVNPPTAVMLQFNDGMWEHRAYWGANQFPWGADGTSSRRNLGALPPTGQWVRLEVPASLVGLEGRTLHGMAFSLVNGRATWDRAGKYAGAAPVQPTISISDVTVNEGNSATTPAMFTVTLSSASLQSISVNYATANGTASSPSDYVGASGTVTFAPGQTSQKVAISVVGDTAEESDEDFFVNLSNPVNATLADSQGVGSILNLSYYDIPVYFHVIQDTQDANNDGQLDGHVDESRLDQQITVLNDAFNGTTVANVQFFFRKAGVTRNFNRDWFNMKVSINDPQRVEFSSEHEAKRLLHQGGANALNFYTISSALQQPEDLYPIGWAWFAEWYAGNRCRDGVVVPFTTLPGDNTPNNPFNKGDLPVHEVGHWLGLYHTYQGSQNSCEQANENGNDQVDDTPIHKDTNVGKCIEADTCTSFPGTDPIYNFMTDYSDECKREFTRGQFKRMRDQYLTLRRPFSTPPQCPVVAISISDATVTEGNSGITLAEFTLTLSNASDQTVSVTYTTANGTATSPRDYEFQSGPVSFAGETSLAPGEISKRIEIRVVGDNVFESNETFVVNLSAPQFAKLGDKSQGVGTIVNDDARPTISISDATVNEGNSGFTPAVFNMTLSNASSQTISVNYATANGTATSPSDYNTQSGTVSFAGETSFAAGETSKLITIQVVGHTVLEPNENFFVNLSNPVNATIADSQGVGIILNDDAAAPVYVGWVDVADCNAIIGWAADRNRLNTSITVSIYDGYNFVTSVPASDLRSDVGVYLGDNGRHGFAITTPPQFKDGLPHALRVKFESSTTELSGSPGTISCATYYEIVARHSGKCLDVEGESMDSGARVIQFGCGGWANQQWQVIPVGGGFYKIVARHSGKVLDVQGGGLGNGTPVWQWDENGTPAQQWEIIDVGGGYVRIMARHSGKALDVEGGFTADGTQVHQWDYVGIANQQWLLRPVP